MNLCCKNLIGVAGVFSNYADKAKVNTQYKGYNDVEASQDMYNTSVSQTNTYYGTDNNFVDNVSALANTSTNAVSLTSVL